MMEANNLNPSTTSPKLVKKPSLGDIRRPSGSDQTAYGCEHTKDLLQNAETEATKQYTRLIQTISRPTDTSSKIAKGDPYITVRPNYLCLQCPTVSSREQRDRHDKSHRFCADSTTGRLFCRECRDFVYDSTFEDIRVQRGQKRKFNAYLSDVDTKILAANSGPTPCRASALRGLYNMGQTCFMSVVLQSLVHNPFIKAYYLGEGHKSADCNKEACISCALDEMFNEFHSTEKAEGYGLVAMLQASWRTGGALAGYQQQDAHEYLQFMLNSLHSANIDPDEKEEKAEDCTCVIHKTFGGLLQSTVTCSKCKNVTVATDPFMDLSLDVRKDAPKKKKDLLDKKDKDKKDAANGLTGPATMNLSECLDRFTSAETLPSAEYTCRKCSSGQPAIKRLRVSRLPPVLPMHLKRFSHTKNSATKLETKVRFPMVIDLAPYAATPKTSKADKEKSKASNGAGKDDAKADQETPSPPVYELSSVIVHKGKMDSGHYVSYSRVDDEWFMFDDSKVVLVEEKEVLGSEAYMLFYIAREIDVG